MGETLEMRGKLAALEQEAMALEMRAESACRTIRRELNTAIIDLDEIDVAMAASEMDNLVMISGELLGIGSKISRLRKELGIGK